MAQTRWSDTVAALYDRGDTLLVLPSEVSAAAWRHALAADPKRRAVRTDRIVSWDVFKERAIPVKRDLQPASRVIRRAFAAGFLRSSAAARLRLLAGTAAGVPAGLDSAVARMLPPLPMLLAEGGALRPELRADLQLLQDAWADFMAAHGLFEPEWERDRSLDLSGIPWRPALLAPELLEDFPEYESLLHGRVELLPLMVAEDRLPARRWGSLHEEVADALDAVEDALQAGVGMQRIAISLADPEVVRPWLDREAARRGIAVHHASGVSVLRSPGGRIFGAIRDVLEADFSVQSLERLLGDRSVAWSRRWRASQLIRFGYLTHCYHADRWPRTLKLAMELADEPENARMLRDLNLGSSEIGELLQEWTHIHRGIRDIVSAKTMEQLQLGLRRFLRSAVRGPGHADWGSTEQIYETALTELDALVAVERRGIPIPAPWAFFLATLEERTYVPRATGSAIPVYPYRVAAGIPADLHCVIGASQAATRVRAEPPLGLRQSELRGIGWLQRDRSRAFLAVYAHPSGGGRVSCSDSGPGGAQVPAAELDVGEAAGHREQTSSWDAEERWWRDTGAVFPTTFSIPQKVAGERALGTVLAPVGRDGRRHSLADAIEASLGHPESYSATDIDAFTDCPFSYLMRARLRLRSDRIGFDPDRAHVLGSVSHRMVERVLLQADDPDRDEVIREAIETEFSRPDAMLFLPEAGLRERMAHLTAVLKLMLERDLVGVGRPGISELDISGMISGVVVDGRMDRVAGVAKSFDHGSTRLTTTDDRPIELIDFKLHLRNHHTRAKVLGSPDEGPRSSTTLQLALYAYLLREETGADVGRARYIDLTSAREIELTRKGASEHPRFAQLLDELPEYIEHMDSQVRAGDFSCRDDHGCDRCRIRSLCRSCFVTRRFGDG